MPQQALFGEISGMQPMNVALMPQQQEKQQRMISSESVEQPKLTDLLASSSSNTHLKMNDVRFIFAFLIKHNFCKN